MAEQGVNTGERLDWSQLSTVMEDVVAKAQALYMQTFQQDPQSHNLDMSRFTRLSQTWAAAAARDPATLLSAQLQYWNEWVALSQKAGLQMLQGQAESSDAPYDKRFRDSAWRDNPWFAYLRDSYQLTTEHALGSVRAVQGLAPQDALQIDFFTRQYLDALAPTNFVHTNPNVLQATLESGGQNLLLGFRNFLHDLQKGNGKPYIKMTDETAFCVGENVATTPGKVIFQNDLMQLIQYAPSTDEVYRRPLLVVPPWINKYYILDLREKNSFLKWLVDQGHSVFVISWVNPDAQLADKGFEDYMLEGPLAALGAIEAATGEREVKAIGYCIGGTLLCATLAYMHVKKDKRIKAATFLTTMTDFSEPGEIGAYIDEEQLALAEREMQNGVFDGANMALVFSSLRANDLIWGFVINNYLLGKDPYPFDLLYWNSDSTRLPAAMHKFYLRKMYLENKLIEPECLSLDGVPIDLRNVQVPSYFLSTKDDHIAPWTSTYAATQVFKGRKKFVLGESGHIAGVVNPPIAEKYGYFSNDSLPQEPQQWLAGATRQDGSWWLDWSKWVARYNGGAKVPARLPGAGDLSVIEDAPGSYVQQR